MTELEKFATQYIKDISTSRDYSDFYRQKEAYRDVSVNGSKEKNGVHGWGVRENTIDNSIQEIVRKLNSLPFVYTSGESCSGTEEDHGGSRKLSINPLITFTLDQTSNHSSKLLGKILEIGKFYFEEDGVMGLKRTKVLMNLPEDTTNSYIQKNWEELEKIIDSF